MTQKQIDVLKEAIMIIATEVGYSNRINQMFEKAFQTQLNKPDVSGALPPSGIEDFDELIKQFQNSEIDFLALTCGLWNKGYNAGKEYCSGGNDR